MKATLIKHTEKIVKKYNTSFHIHIDEYKTFFEFSVQNRNYPQSFWYTLKLYKKNVKDTDEAIETGLNTYFNDDLRCSYEVHKAHLQAKARKEAKADIIIETRTLSEAQNIEEVAAANNVFSKMYAEEYKANLEVEIARKALEDAERAERAARAAVAKARKALEDAAKTQEEAQVMKEAAEENYNEVKALHIYFKEAEEANEEAVIAECREEKAKAKEKEEKAKEIFDEEVQNFDTYLYEFEEEEEAKECVKNTLQALMNAVYYNNKVAYYEERIERIYNRIDMQNKKEKVA